MEKTIDARGQTSVNQLVLAQNVLKTLSVDDKLNVVVDDITSAQNLEMMADEMNLPSQKIQQGTDYVVSLFVKKSFFVPQQDEIKKAEPLKLKNSFIVLIDSNLMGNGDEKLGAVLMKSFIYTLATLEEMPTKIVLYNSGVKLAAEGSEVLADLKRLQNGGAEIFVSSTSLEYYGLKDKLATGKPAGMADIVQIQLKAEKILRP
ncbi:sulfurtransferase-like selenium metabolism protein YedF [Megamonas hypermegale]|uniref:sulfurtransferase-like selenium metabolism protein YedF n=1 Tax=Megamonas hypermegale TaxID=158847 RepID=UPI0025A4B8BB|nr:sulfurtransferase-like selenium metabolism protein YedF [Megamonas hypermegale]MDM8142398.1 sulfurtransferase-like selenium metabolism protein YedF [Megamonas hypermegale]